MATCDTLATKASLDQLRKEFEVFKISTNTELKKKVDSSNTEYKNTVLTASTIGLAVGATYLKNQVKINTGDINQAKSDVYRLQNSVETVNSVAKKAAQRTEEAVRAVKEAKAAADRAEAETSVAKNLGKEAKTVASNANKAASEASNIAKNALGKAESAFQKATSALAELPGIKQLAQLAKSDAAQSLLKVLGVIGVVTSIFDLLNTFATFESVNAAQKAADSAFITSQQAFSEAISAKSQARTANKKSDIATSKASTAVSEAQTATNRATDAIQKAGLAETRAINAQNTASVATEVANQAKSDSSNALSIANQARQEVNAIKGTVSSLRSRLEDLAATQSLQSVQLKQALNELSRLETLVASLEGEVEGLEDSKADTSRINALNGLIGDAKGTASKAIELAEKAIQLAANNGAGQYAAQLKGQIDSLKGNFESQKATTTTQINQLDSKVQQLQTNAPESQKLSTQQAEQVRQIAKNEIKTITPQIVKENTVNEQEFEKLITNNNNKLLNFLIPGLTIALLPQILPKLNQINSTTNQIKDTPKSPCLAPVYVPPVGANVQRNIGLTTGLHAYTATQTTAIKADTTVINTQVAQVNAKTNAIQSATNTVLTKVGEVATSITKLWRLIGVDRWINYVNMALLFHNALMLSNNLGQTAISAIENVFQLFGLKLHDDKGEEIDLSTLVGHTVENVAKAALGNENYTTMVTSWKKANRIYQTGMNILYSVQGIGNSLQSLTQLAIENTGKIGNALRKAGAVLENAYAPMVEKVTAYTPFQRQLETFNNTVQGAENAISNLDNVTSEVTSMNDAKKELFGDGTPGNKGQIKEFEDSVKTKSDAKKTEDDASKSSSSTVEITKPDLVKPDTP